MTHKNSELTAKAQRTRQRIFDVAIEQFVQNGYEATSMRAIATAADCSLGLAYRYFESKEAMMLLLWEQLASDFAELIKALDDGNLSERYYQAMRLKIEGLEPYREVIQATFGAAMNPASGIAVVGAESTDYRNSVLDSLELLLAKSSDAPKEIHQKQIALLMYGIHLLIILLWIYDRSPKQRLTQDVLSFMYDTMKLLRPILLLPPVTKLLARLASIMEGIFIPENSI